MMYYGPNSPWGMGPYQQNNGLTLEQLRSELASSGYTPTASQDSVFGNPFATATSGGVKGTLQPYINKQNDKAYQSLYGGLMGYAPQDMMAGNAGGTPTNATGANMSIQGLLGNFKGFGNRSWMKN